MFNFVIDCADAALEKYLALSPQEYAQVFTRGDLNWCLQTYLKLAASDRLYVQCSNRLQKDCVNIIHSDHLLKIRGSTQHFIVCVRADYPQRRWAHYHLVQNGHQLKGAASYLPHWVQPGLMKRDANRRGVETVAYAGAPVKGNLAWPVEEWKKLFTPYGIDFVSLPSGTWHDLSKVDVLIGIRSFGQQPHHSKPPTKLFNAWHTNIPFIGGYDSAFREVATPGKDYLLAATPQEVLLQVLRLQSDPALYETLVQNGQRKALQYSEQAIAEAWEKTLTGPVLKRYTSWRSRPAYERLRFSLLLDLGLWEQKSRQLVKRMLNKRLQLPFIPKPASGGL